MLTAGKVVSGSHEAVDSPRHSQIPKDCCVEVFWQPTTGCSFQASRFIGGASTATRSGVTENPWHRLRVCAREKVSFSRSAGGTGDGAGSVQRFVASNEIGISPIRARTPTV